jgi:hypothetical protein
VEKLPKTRLGFSPKSHEYLGLKPMSIFESLSTS